MTDERFIEAVERVLRHGVTCEDNLAALADHAPDPGLREEVLGAAATIAAARHRLRAAALNQMSHDGVTSAPDLLAPLDCGPLKIDRASRIVTTADGTTIHLSAKEYGLLCALASDPTRVFTKQELLGLVWGGLMQQRQGASKGYGTRTCDSHACRLRAKLAAVGIGGIVSVWGVGYRLFDPVPESRRLEAVA